MMQRYLVLLALLVLGCGEDPTASRAGNVSHSEDERGGTDDESAEARDPDISSGPGAGDSETSREGNEGEDPTTGDSSDVDDVDRRGGNPVDDEGSDEGSDAPSPGDPEDESSDVNEEDVTDWTDRVWADPEGPVTPGTAMTVHVRPRQFSDDEHLAYAILTDMPANMASMWTQVQSPLVGVGEAMHIVFEAPALIDPETLEALRASGAPDIELTYPVRDRRDASGACADDPPTQKSWPEDTMELRTYAWSGAQPSLITCSIGGFVETRWFLSPEDGRPLVDMTFTVEFSDGTHVIDQRTRIPYTVIEEPR